MPSLILLDSAKERQIIHTCTFLHSGVQENKEEKSRPWCAHTDIHTNTRHAECATPTSNGMPRLSVCESSLFVARLFTVEQPVHCHSSSFPLCNLKHHWLHTLTCMQSSKGGQIFSMINWLYFILFNTTTSLAFLECPRPHTCRKVCESSPPPYFSNCDLWWFDELQRDSGRVYGTAESGISSASFKVLHLTLVPVIFAIYTTPTFHLPCLSTSFFPPSF